MDIYITRDCLRFGAFDLIDPTHIFEEDNKLYYEIRSNINKFIDITIKDHSKSLILEVGPKNFEPNNKFLVNDNVVETVDIIQNNKTTYVHDLTTSNNIIPEERYDVIYCLEVIEHCSDPLSLLNNLYKLLKANGVLYLSWPFQFRIHGPIPDNYRISEYGMKNLLVKSNFSISEMSALIDNKRPAFPISYTAICKKLRIM